MTNWKVYTIIKIPQIMHSGSRNGSFDLDGWAECSDVNTNCIWCVNTYPYNTFKLGDKIEIDNDRIKYYSAYHDFNDLDIVRKYSPSNIITTRGSSSDIIISPNAVNAMNSPNAMDLARRMSEMVDATGKEYEFKIEDPSSKLNYSLICRKSN